MSLKKRSLFLFSLFFILISQNGEAICVIDVARWSLRHLWNLPLLLRPAPLAPLANVDREVMVSVNDPLSLIPFFDAGLVEISLSREGRGRYVIDFNPESKWDRRLNASNPKTVKLEELDLAVQAARRDAGWEVKTATTLSPGKDRLAINVTASSSDLTDDKLIRFQNELLRRVRELKNPLEARRSRQSTVRHDANLKAAALAENSGFDNTVVARVLLKWPHLDGDPVYPGRSDSALYPLFDLAQGKSSLLELTIDTDYYRDPGTDPKEDIIREVRKYAMTPVNVEDDGRLWLVYHRYIPKTNGVGGYEKFLAFYTQELALAYVNTHRFVKDEL